AGEPRRRGRKVLEDLADDPQGRAGAWARICANHALGGALPIAGAVAPPPGKGGRGGMELVEKALMLRTAGSFDATRDEVLAEVAAIAEMVDASSGTKIVEQGSPGDSMYVIASGLVRVHHGHGTLNELGVGEVFGEMALLDPEPRSA